ncbi:MAG: sulfatase-like hydrolase/transferase [Candidatus Delongbacteria bacterium]|nr:sulfatase-like hydrolase/transferase [Candidatus Delongbacteria bacterium]
MAVRVVKNTFPALVIMWMIFFIEQMISRIEYTGYGAAYFFQQLKVFASYTVLGMIIGGIGAGILAKKRKKYSNYFESEQDRYYKYFLKNSGISLMAIFSLTVRELINHPLLYSRSLLNPSFWFSGVFVFLKDNFSPLYFTIFFIIILAMCVHNLMYNLSIYHGAKRVSLYSATILSGILLLFNFGYLNAFEVKGEKNIILIGVEDLSASNLTNRKISDMQAIKMLKKRSYTFSNCYGVSNDPRVNLLSVLTSVHPEKGGYLGGYRTYGLENRTVFSILERQGYRTGMFSDREFYFFKMNDKNNYLAEYPTNKELIKSEVLLSHMIMPVVFNNRFLIKYFPEILLLEQYRDKSYLKGRIAEMIDGKEKFMFLYTITCKNDGLPFPYYRTSNFESGENAFLNYLNDELSFIYDELKDCGKLEDTVICLFGLPGGSEGLKAADLRLPLIIGSDDFDMDRIVKNNYSTLDILPTVLDAAGIKASSGNPFDGVSFFHPEFVQQEIIVTDASVISSKKDIYFKDKKGYVSKNSAAEREIYPMIKRALIRGDYKLDITPGASEVSYNLFDISGDREEKEDLKGKEISLFKKMKSLYEEKISEDLDLLLMNGYVLK